MLREAPREAYPSGANFWEHRMIQNAKMAKTDSEKSLLKGNNEGGSDSSPFATDIRNAFPMNVTLERTDILYHLTSGAKESIGKCSPRLNMVKCNNDSSFQLGSMIPIRITFYLLYFPVGRWGFLIVIILQRKKLRKLVIKRHASSCPTNGPNSFFSFHH